MKLGDIIHKYCWFCRGTTEYEITKEDGYILKTCCRCGNKGA